MLFKGAMTQIRNDEDRIAKFVTNPGKLIFRIWIRNVKNRIQNYFYPIII